ncbi:MAG TPA: DUF2721 domain-containing protein [Candidatus Acidoferrum sp.]|nr:DUF2721 domain-containing protein [Candidatus Acidoferrum sp.]
MDTGGLTLLFGAGDISKVINLSVAPVFLLTGISGMLNVLSARMGRIIDRGRRLNEIAHEPGSPHAEEVDNEQGLLAQRARLIHLSFRMCTLSALLICLVIITLFIGVLWEISLQPVSATLFMLALVSLSFGLLTFLREINISMGKFRFGKYRVHGQD